MAQKGRESMNGKLPIYPLNDVYGENMSVKVPSHYKEAFEKARMRYWNLAGFIPQYKILAEVIRMGTERLNEVCDQLEGESK